MSNSKTPALFYQKVYAIVARIPAGKVTSYGRIAEMIGASGAARQVGYAMSALKNRSEDPRYGSIPWQRVVGHDGKIVIKGSEHSRFYQAELLRDEGVEIYDDLRVKMDTHIWEGLLPHEVEEITKDLSEE